MAIILYQYKCTHYIIFQMVLGVGLISAIIVAKKGAKGKTRLQKFQQKLLTKPLKQTTFYEIPSKRIFSIFIIIAFILFFNYFQTNYLLQFMESHSSNKNILQQQTLLQVKQNYGKLCNVLKWIKIAYLIMIFGVIADLKVKIVTVEPTRLQIIQYDRNSFGSKKIIIWTKQENKFQIQCGGQQKFTHNTGHYVIKLVNKKTETSEQIFKRYGVFHARKALIEMGSILDFKPDLQIH